MRARAFGVLLILAASLPALPANFKGSGNRVMIRDQALLDLNQINAYVTNYGILFHNAGALESGLWWPKNRPNETYIFGAGLWIGALVRTEDGRLDTNVTCGYNPSSGAGEFVPAHVVPGIAPIKDSDARNYSVALGDPYDRVHIFGKTTAQGYEWPLRTAEGEDSVVSLQDSYMLFTDADPSAHFSSLNRPLNVVVEQQTYAFIGPLKEDALFLITRIYNPTPDTFYNVYIAITFDNDVGNEREGNDQVDFVRTLIDTLPNGQIDTVQLNMAYQYQTETEPGWLGPRGDGYPGVVACMFLKSPKATDTVRLWDPDGSGGLPTDPDSALIIPPGEEIGLTAFRVFNREDVDPADKWQRYLVLSGHDYATGVYDPFGGDFHTPRDKRFVMATGPFTLYPDSIVEMINAIFVAPVIPTPGGEVDLQPLFTYAKAILTVYQSNFQGPKPPPTPQLQAWPRDKEVRLFWDMLAEITPDPFYEVVKDSLDQAGLENPQYNPAYRQYDFEGYLLRRTVDGVNYDTLGIWDLNNEFTVVYTDSLLDPVTGDPVYTDSIVLGSNTGLVHYYVDDSLINGVQYQYELIAYDINYSNVLRDSTGTIVRPLVPIQPFSLTSPPAIVRVAPKSLAANFEEGVGFYRKQGLENTSSVSDIFPLSPDTTISRPGTYHLIWEHNGGAGLPDLSITIEDAVTGETLLAHVPIQFPEFPFGSVTGTLPLNELNLRNYVIEGFQVELNLDSAWFTFPEDLVVLYGDSVETPPDSTWRIAWKPRWYPGAPIPGGGPDDSTRIYRYKAVNAAFFYGADYLVRWKELPGDSLTLEVYWVIDDTLRIPVPFDPNMGVQVTVTEGFGWSFVAYNRNVHAIYKYDPTGFTSIRGFRLPGSRLFLFEDFDGAAHPPEPGTEWWIRTADFGRMPLPTDTSVYHLPIGDLSIIETTPNQTTTDYTLDAVRVVPNPYVVLTPLDLSKEYRKGVRFTNLPSRCTIRIYTIAGDLVKKIEVNAPIDGQEVFWDLLTEYKLRTASGIFIYHIETPDGKKKIGKFAVIQ